MPFSKEKKISKSNLIILTKKMNISQTQFSVLVSGKYLHLIPL